MNRLALMLSHKENSSNRQAECQPYILPVDRESAAATLFLRVPLPLVLVHVG
jgi:hypothetical protein